MGINLRAVRMFQDRCGGSKGRRTLGRGGERLDSRGVIELVVAGAFGVKLLGLAQFTTLCALGHWSALLFNLKEGPISVVTR